MFCLFLMLSQIHSQLDKEFISCDPCGGRLSVILSCHHVPFMEVWHPDGVLAVPLCVCAHVSMHICNLIPSFFTAYAVTCSSIMQKQSGEKNCCGNIFSIDGNNHM